MKSLPREKIEQITKDILDGSDFIAMHGTSIAAAKKILETGFKWHRTSFIVLKKEYAKSTSAEVLTGYGWKENGENDSTNVVLSLPKDFIKDWYGLDDKRYAEFIKNKNADQLFLSFGSTNISNNANKNSAVTNSFDSQPSIPLIQWHLPKELIAGVFIWCDGKTYLNLKPDESAMDHLTFVTNPKFYSNLSKKEKEEFINNLKNQLFSRFQSYEKTDGKTF